MVKLTITISKEMLFELENFVNENQPYEACAILLGRKVDNNYHILQITPFNNKDKSEVRFSIEETKLFEIYRHAEDNNLNVVGIFHSHPSLPVPSKIDINFMEINPIPWMIKSTTTDEIRCYIHDETFGVKEIEIKKIME